MEEKLSEYKQKRNFEKTPEPKGLTEKPKKDLRFVIQHHIARRDHYDFRLEWNGVLLSWAVPKGPSYNPQDKRLSVHVEDHPLEYRNFEGTIPKGEYGGGTVMLWDEGWWTPDYDADEGLRKGVLKFTLKGKRLRGKWSLVRLEKKECETQENWLLLKEKDEYAKTTEGIAEFNNSIRTGRTMKEIEEGKETEMRNPFNKADVQLARLVNTVPEGDDWLFELKFDGYRILTFVEGGSVRLITRNGNDYTRQFKDIVDSLITLADGRAMVLDGEMAIMDESGKTDFQALQNYIKKPKGKTLTYIVFDLLALDGADLRNRPLTERKETLEILMKDAPKRLFYSRHVRGNGKENLVAACKAGMEGIIGKKANSVYSGTRNSDWIKFKCGKRQEFVIGGYTQTDKKTSGVSSLILGIYEGGELVYAGRAGTGLSESEMRDLEEQFKSIKREKTPFKTAPKPRTNEKIFWVEPELIAEVKFAEWTEENLLRQASFKGLRADKDPRDIRREITDDKVLPYDDKDEEIQKPMELNADKIIEGIKITNPDKVIFDDPKITKGDIIRYYAKISERMLPYVSHRILSLVRCPKGLSEPCFFKKHPGPESKGIITIPVINAEGESETFFYIDNAAGLISEAQMGTLEFHIWGSRIEDVEKPDFMVFDLDPGEGLDIDTVRQGVKDLKNILENLSLKAYLKTSGGKGYHVAVPFKPAASWDKFHDFAQRIAQVMEQKWPQRYTSNIRKSKRTDKIFIDWLRNGKGSTCVAPYSVRAKKGAKVSMPISWNELETIAPDSINMEEALRRISSEDPWKDFYKNNHELKD